MNIKERLKKFYDAYADFYEEVEEPNEYLACEAHFYTPFLKGKILDLGCGTGRHLKLIKKMGFFVVGLDISHKMLLASKIKDNLILGDAESLPLRSNSFDTVMCMFNTFGQFPDREKVVKEVRRILKKDGAFIFTVFYDNNPEEFFLREFDGKRFWIYVHSFSLEEIYSLFEDWKIKIEFLDKDFVGVIAKLR
ncbi:MAG: class I SAM-dependent methyltransferase [Candidatus Hydrothermarchaeota archaeon]